MERLNYIAEAVTLGYEAGCTEDFSIASAKEGKLFDLKRKR